jgi:hypothetical protein
MGRKGLSLLAIGMVLFTASPLFALNTEMNRMTLQGLKGVKVLVEDLAPEVEREGLLKDRLQKEIEDRVRAAGIKVLTQEETTRTPGEPYLYVNINVTLSKDDEAPCSYSIDIALIQNVTLTRDPRQTTYAVTWSSGGVGLIGRKSLSDLREISQEIVDIFIRAFSDANPKK